MSTRPIYTGLLSEKGYLLDLDQDKQLTSGEDVQNEESGASGEDKEQKTKQAQQALSKESSDGQLSLQSNNSVVKTLPDVEGLEKYEITLVNRKKAYLYVPVPLPYGEKERLKKYIDFRRTTYSSIKTGLSNISRG